MLAWGPQAPSLRNLLPSWWVLSLKPCSCWRLDEAGGLFIGLLPQPPVIRPWVGLVLQSSSALLAVPVLGPGLVDVATSAGRALAAAPTSPLVRIIGPPCFCQSSPATWPLPVGCCHRQLSGLPVLCLQHQPPGLRTSPEAAQGCPWGLLSVPEPSRRSRAEVRLARLSMPTSPSPLIPLATSDLAEVLTPGSRDWLFLIQPSVLPALVQPQAAPCSSCGGLSSPSPGRDRVSLSLDAGVVARRG